LVIANFSFCDLLAQQLSPLSPVHIAVSDKDGFAIDRFAANAVFEDGWLNVALLKLRPIFEFVVFGPSMLSESRFLLKTCKWIFHVFFTFTSPVSRRTPAF
jgi:hypothetical protein